MSASTGAYIIQVEYRALFEDPKLIEARYKAAEECGLEIVFEAKMHFKRDDSVRPTFLTSYVVVPNDGNMDLREFRTRILKYRHILLPPCAPGLFEIPRSALCHDIEGKGYFDTVDKAKKFAEDGFFEPADKVISKEGKVIDNLEYFFPYGG